MGEQWTESCPVCMAELATVQMFTSEGNIRVGSKCSRILEQLAKLMGAETKRIPALKVLR